MVLFRACMFTLSDPPVRMGCFFMVFFGWLVWPIWTRPEPTVVNVLEMK